ncbi:EG45-like domain containing protein [Durio zibethinus]|uniref:EG45-like domain containing protein n=1 Tax=Durio zibethinus TaxID=66656 RepID=A0A6P5X9P7_DURZI|nr:EG45-like domain containing protein [Durio zibethinus]
MQLGRYQQIFPSCWCILVSADKNNYMGNGSFEQPESSSIEAMQVTGLQDQEAVRECNLLRSLLLRDSTDVHSPSFALSSCPCSSKEEMVKFSNVLICISIAFMVCISSREAVADKGTATFYTPPYVPSSCYGYDNEGVMIAAASDAIWDNRAACGRKYEVRCIGATNQGDPHPCRGNEHVVVKIVDYCPSPACQGTIDLSQEAFAAIANPDAGKIQISFQQI